MYLKLFHLDYTNNFTIMNLFEQLYSNTYKYLHSNNCI